MKTLNSFFLKGIVSVSLMACSFSGFSALEVKGFSLSEQDLVRSVYGSCHRLEEPLTVKLHMNTDFVAFGNGWQFELIYKLKEEKKYKTAFFSADFNKLTNGEGNENIFRGTAPHSVVRSATVSAVTANDGNNEYFLVLPTRNIEKLSLRVFSPTNGNGGYFNWYIREGNYLSGADFSGGSSQPERVSINGFADNRDARFNLLSVDHLAISFVQTMGGVGFYPKWSFTAVEMDFQDRGPYTAAQYKAACK